MASSLKPMLCDGWNRRCQGKCRKLLDTRLRVSMCTETSRHSEYQFFCAVYQILGLLYHYDFVVTEGFDRVKAWHWISPPDQVRTTEFYSCVIVMQRRQTTALASPRPVSGVPMSEIPVWDYNWSGIRTTDNWIMTELWLYSNSAGNYHLMIIRSPIARCYNSDS